MAKYTMKKLAGGMHGQGEKTFPKLMSSGVTGIDAIAETIEYRTSFTRGDVAGLLAELAAVVAENVAKGRTVKIDGLGSFRAVLGLVGKEERGPWTEDGASRLATGRNVRLKTVNFRPDVELTHQVEQRMELERVKDMSQGNEITSTLEERASAARKFISENGFIRVGDYTRITGLPRSTASVELRRLSEDETSGIVSRGVRAGKIYLSRE